MQINSTDNFSGLTLHEYHVQHQRDAWDRTDCPSRVEQILIWYHSYIFLQNLYSLISCHCQGLYSPTFLLAGPLQLTLPNFYMFKGLLVKMQKTTQLYGREVLTCPTPGVRTNKNTKHQSPHLSIHLSWMLNSLVFLQEGWSFFFLVLNYSEHPSRNVHSNNLEWPPSRYV